MEFEDKYLSYSEYLDIGGTLEDTPFHLFEYKAEMEINKYTFNRLEELQKIPQEVKMCAYELINLMYIQSKISEHSDISSENIDGYSVSYSKETTETQKTYNDKIKSIITTCLSNVTVTIEDEEIPVLYRGRL